MPWSRPTWSAPRTWFLTVRLIESALVLLTVGMVLIAYAGWRSARDTGPSGQMGPDGRPLDLNLADTIAMSVSYNWFSVSGHSGLVVMAVLVLAVVAILHRVHPVSHARVLRWEVAALGGVAALVSLAFVLAWVMVALTPDPFKRAGSIIEGEQVIQVETYDGPSRLQLGLMNMGLPATAVLLLAVAALWWLRLPEEFEEVELAEAGAGAAAVAAGADADGAATPRPARPRAKRSWRPAPAADPNVDDITLEGVELIEPVERLRPREGGSGATSSGYEDYYRRF
jgi:hypothetical protein